MKRVLLEDQTEVEEEAFALGSHQIAGLSDYFVLAADAVVESVATFNCQSERIANVEAEAEADGHAYK